MNTKALPNEVLDLPFIWRAMQWAKPNGQIAFALHARLLFQQGDGMADARLAIFEALDVTSIINGVELRQTKVWPEIAAPFCLLFAKNRVPSTGAGFRFVSPRLEKTLNDAGCMRINALSAEIVPIFRLSEFPEILKVLFKGSKLDLGIIERLRGADHPCLRDLWAAKVGMAGGTRLLGSGNGYQTLKPSSRTRINGDGLPSADANYLSGLPEFSVNALSNVLVDTSKLGSFIDNRIHDPRDARLFDAPLLLVHQSPPAHSDRIRVAVSDKPVAFNESFYGYSAGDLDDGALFVRYLALIIGSKFALWMALLTSGKFGFEIEVIEMASLSRPAFGAIP